MTTTTPLSFLPGKVDGGWSTIDLYAIVLGLSAGGIMCGRCNVRSAKICCPVCAITPYCSEECMMTDKWNHMPDQCFSMRQIATGLLTESCPDFIQSEKGDIDIPPPHKKRKTVITTPLRGMAIVFRARADPIYMGRLQVLLGLMPRPGSRSIIHTTCLPIITQILQITAPPPFVVVSRVMDGDRAIAINTTTVDAVNGFPIGSDTIEQIIPVVFGPVISSKPWEKGKHIPLITNHIIRPRRDILQFDGVLMKKDHTNAWSAGDIDQTAWFDAPCITLEGYGAAFAPMDTIATLNGRSTTWNKTVSTLLIKPDGTVRRWHDSDYTLRVISFGSQYFIVWAEPNSIYVMPRTFTPFLVDAETNTSTHLPVHPTYTSIVGCAQKRSIYYLCDGGALRCLLLDDITSTFRDVIVFEHPPPGRIYITSSGIIIYETPAKEPETIAISAYDPMVVSSILSGYTIPGMSISLGILYLADITPTGPRMCRHGLPREDSSETAEYVLRVEHDGHLEVRTMIIPCKKIFSSVTITVLDYDTLVVRYMVRPSSTLDDCSTPFEREIRTRGLETKTPVTIFRVWTFTDNTWGDPYPVVGTNVEISPTCFYPPIVKRIPT